MVNKQARIEVIGKIDVQIGAIFARNIKFTAFFATALLAILVISRLACPSFDKNLFAVNIEHFANAHQGQIKTFFRGLYRNGFWWRVFLYVYVIAIQINRHFKVRQVSVVYANIADSVFTSESFKFAKIFLQAINKVLAFFHGNLALLKATNEAACLLSN